MNLLHWDSLVFHWIRSWTTSPPLQTCFTYLSMLGDGYFNIYLALGIGIWQIFVRRKKAFLSLHILNTWFFAGIIADTIKRVVARPRPLNIHNLTSFPSGHSATVFALATLFSLRYPRKQWLFWPIAFMVSLSRVIIGVHYPLDVTAGGAIGILTTILYFYIVKKLKNQVNLRKSRNKIQPEPSST